ncbi:amino acid adenylation domain-containing protein, partial [Corallococcus sp. bb12-1]|uniref:non-ribosomal peptide synthetase n=1 Tax=Corallococcus sp. bb12-1 TaxID=2996784 RepID=UPI00226EA33A
TQPTLGGPLLNVRTYVLDAHQQPVPVGVAGELFIAGAGLARGYLGQPARTAEHFVPNPFATTPGERMYRTGDKARWSEDGTLEYLGRIDFQVKLRGLRIELGEIEALLRQHPAVAQALVLVREDVPGNARLVAYVVPSTRAPDAVELRAFLQQTLPESMAPAAYVMLDALPLTPNGKVDRKALPAPEAQAHGHEAPRPGTEEKLAALWADVLRVPTVGAQDDFFALGGHSLLATRVVARIRAAFDVELPVRALFEEPTLRRLAARIEHAGRARELPAFVPVPRTDTPPPLSFAQQRMWFLDQLQPGSPAYNIPVALRIHGALNGAALERAFEALVHRHEALRTSIAQHEGVPVQHIHPPAPFHLPCTDLMDAANSEAEARRLAAEEAARPFDLATGPLLRVHLLRLGESQHVLLLTLHHIISDGESTGVLVREVAALYEGFHDGRPTALPTLPVQYADHAAWQRSWLHGDVLERQVAWWRQHLAEAPAHLELPTDFARPPVPSTRGASVHFRLPASLLRTLETFSQQEGATLFMGLLAATSAVLSRYTGQDDVVIGTPIAGRRFAELEGLIGLFVNTLALRARLEDGASFRKLLAQVRETTLEAHSHQDVPFEKLVEELRPRRDLSRAPLFQAMLLVQNATDRAPQTSQLSFEPVEVEQVTAKFDLTFAFSASPEGLAGSVTYSTDLFREDSIRRLVSHFQRLLEGALARPEVPLQELPLLSTGEREQLLTAWDADAPPLRRAPLHQRIEAQVLRTPEATALIVGDQRLSYASLDLRANQLAHALRARGVGPEVRVAVLLPRTEELLVTLLAVLKAGGAYVPLDPAYPRQRLDGMLADSGASLLVTLQSLVDLLGPTTAARAVLYLDTGVEDLASRSHTPPAVEVPTDALAYVIYTSGSTGTPKGVALSHANASAFLDWACRVFSPAQLAGTLAATSVCFDLSVFELFAPLCCGGTVLLAHNVLALASLPARDEVTLVNTVPSAMAELLRAGALPASVRTVNLAGEPLPGSLARALHATGSVQHVFNLYGPTEDTTYSTFLEVPPGAGEPTLGRPLTETSAYVLDARLQLQPPGVPGELFLAGAGLARGYLNRPALTAERFVPDPFSLTPGARMYRTGDLVRRRADAQLEYLGRTDFMVKLRGFRIELGEIEATLRQHPSVQQALVLARRDSPTGDPRLVAYVVGANSHPSELRAHLQQKLPEYMVPAVYVQLDAFPLTPNGKVDRKALPAPEASATQRDRYVAPRTTTERQLAALWAEVLRVERVGNEDHFFELGGHSLLATQVVARVRATFGVELPLRALFEEPTLRRLAARIEHAGRARELPAFVPVPRTDTPPPLSFAQQRMWFLDQLQPGSPAYNIPVALRIHGALDAAALERAFEALVHRHEALRTTIAQHEGVPVQHIHPPAPFHLPCTDLSGSTNPEAEARRLAAEEAARPFDLATGPLLRAHLLRLGESQHVLLLTLHHIISDGESTGVLVREVAALYQGFHDGRPTALPALPVQYADHAAWQRSWLHGDVLERQVAWWRQHLAEAPAHLELPTDFARPPVPSTRGASVHFRLPASLLRTLESFSQQEGATLFMGLLAATSAVLSRYTGQDDVVIGTPIAGRRFAELEGLIGLFVNTLALRARLEDGASFRKLLAQVRETTLEAHSHQDVPFEKLVEELRPRRDLSRAPLFQAMLLVQNATDRAPQTSQLSFEPVEVEQVTAKFDLTFAFSASPEGLAGSVTYSTDLFREDSIRRLVSHFQRLLEGALAHPESPLQELPLLSTGEREQLLTAWDADAPPLCRAPLHQRIEAQVLRTPEATALIVGDQRLSYASLDLRANQLAHALRARGVGPEVRVAVLLPRTEDLLVTLLAVLKAGGAYVPLDPAYPRQRLDGMLADSGASLLVTLQSLVDLLGPTTAARAVLYLDTGVEDLASRSHTPPAVEVPTDALAYVIYTSGSTGTPKGVALSHANASAFLDWACRVFSPAQLAGTLAATSVCFDLSVFELFAPLCCGGTVLLADNVLALASLPARDEVTLVNTVPSAMAELLRAGALPASVRTVNLAGEPLPGALARALHATGSVQQVFNLYGPTEDTTYSTFLEVPAGDGEPTLGRPLTQTHAYVLDARLQLQPPGVPGELFLAGAGLARGYLNRPALTAERFLPDPFSTQAGARMYRTGDRVRRLSDGTLEYLGRIDFQVKLRGFRIELGEIEAVLQLHPDVDQTLVMVREDAPGHHVLTAYFTAKATRPEASALRAFLQQRLPEYMVPAAFVALASFPLTPNGKRDRKALPAPERTGLTASARFVAPRDALELELTRIWEDVLQTRPLSVTSDFFELGGHSLLAVRLMSRIRTGLRRDLPLATLFQAPTVERLAALLRQQPAPFSPLVPIQSEGTRRPFFCVHPVGGNVLAYAELAKALGPDQPFYGLQSQGLDGAQPPLERVEEMAASYLAAVRGVQPHGPYRLGGWSMGGLVAYEMARQLQALGETTEVLALIEPSPAQASAEAADAEDPQALALRFVGDYAGLVNREAWTMDFTESEPGVESVLERLRAAGQSAGLLAPETGAAQVRTLFDVFTSNLRAMRRYEPGPFTGPLVVLRASERPPSDPLDRGWKAQVPHAQIQEVQGDHYSLLRAEHVQHVAAHLG